MAKLPTKDDLGAPGSFRSGRAMLSAEDFGAGGQAAAHGLKKIGQGMGKLTAMAVETAQEDDAMDLMRADASHKRAMMEAERAFDTDPEFHTYDKRFGPSAAAITDSSASMIRNPKVREKWQLKAASENEGYRNRILDRGTRLAREQKIVDVENAIGQYRSVYDAAGSDLSKRTEALGNIDTAIALAEKSGLVDPSSGAALRQKHLGGTLESYYRGLIDNGENEKALDELENIKDPSFSIVQPTIKRAANIGRQRSGPVKGIVVHETQGSDTMEGNGSWSNKKNTGANYYIDKSGSIIQWAPDDVAMNHAGIGRGGKGDARPDLQNNNTISVEIMTRPGEQPNESQKAALHYLTKMKAGEYGFKPNDIEAHGRLAPGHKEATEATSAVDFVRQNWDSDPQVAAVGSNVSQPVPMGNRGLTTYAQLKPGQTATDAVQAEELSAASSTPNYYRYLSPDRRKALVFEARRAGIADAQNGIKGALEKIRKGSEPDRDPQGRTAFDKARRFLQPNQIAKMEFDIREANMARDAIVPLKDMSDDDVDAHIGKFLPRSDTPDDDYAIMNSVHEDATKEWKKIKDLRDKDAVKSILDSKDYKTEIARSQKAVAAVGLQIDEEGNIAPVTEEVSIGPTEDGARRMIIEARLKAQARRNISPFKQRIISEKEAIDLLQFADTDDMPPNELMGKLQEAADRAEATYGPAYAKRAMEEAIKFVVKGKDQKMVASGLVSQMITGEMPSNEDYRSAKMLADMDAFGRSFESGFEPSMGDASRPMISPMRDAAVSLIGANAASEARKAPFPEEIDELRRRPEHWQKFDLLYGKGAAARALANPGAMAPPALGQTKTAPQSK